MNRLQKILQGFGFPKHVASEFRKTMFSEKDRVTGDVEISSDDQTIIVISSSAPDDNDGRSDGTVYIQTA